MAWIWWPMTLLRIEQSLRQCKIACSHSKQKFSHQTFGMHWPLRLLLPHFAYTYHILIIYCRSPFEYRHELGPFFAIRFYLPFCCPTGTISYCKLMCVGTMWRTFFVWVPMKCVKLKRQCNIHFRIHSLNTNCTWNFNSNCFFYASNVFLANTLEEFIVLWGRVEKNAVYRCIQLKLLANKIHHV